MQNVQQVPAVLHLDQPPSRKVCIFAIVPQLISDIGLNGKDAFSAMAASPAASAALSEPPATEEQINEASEKAYEEAMLLGDTEMAFTAVVTLGQYLSDLMVFTYGDIPASGTDSANAAVQLVDEVIRRADLCFRSQEAGTGAEKLAVFDRVKTEWKTAADQRKHRHKADVLVDDQIESQEVHRYYSDGPAQIGYPRQILFRKLVFYSKDGSEHHLDSAY